MVENREQNKKRLTIDPYPFKTENESLVCRVMEKGETAIAGRSFGRYVVADKNGEQWLLYGSVSLDMAIQRASNGAWLEVVYKGVEDGPSGYPMKRFEVFELE